MKVRRVDFYPADWLSGTRGLTNTQCGLYWNICALIYERGGPVSLREVKRMFRGKRFQETFDELCAAGKLSTSGATYQDMLETPETVMVSQSRCDEELVRAGLRIDSAAKAAAKRWENHKKDDARALPSTNNPDNAEENLKNGPIDALSMPNRVPIASSSGRRDVDKVLINHDNSHADAMLSYSIQHIIDSPNGESCPIPKNGALRIDDEFTEKFWPLYPKHEAKADALKAFKQARKTTSLDEILDGLARYRAAMSGKDREFIKLAAGWLRSKRWLDEPAPPLLLDDDVMRGI